MIIVGFSAFANNGKTTLISKLCNILTKKFNVAVIKHDPKNKAKIDYEGKDSAILYDTGANIALISPLQTTIRYHNELNINQAIDILSKEKQHDYIFIEGFRDYKIPRICTVINQINIELIREANLIAIKQNRLTLLDQYNNIIKCDIINLDDTQSILNWINENGNS